MRCFNPKVLGALAAAAVSVLVISPNASATAIPFLVLLVCPLSMSS